MNIFKAYTGYSETHLMRLKHGHHLKVLLRLGVRVVACIKLVLLQEINHASRWCLCCGFGFRSRLRMPIWQFSEVYRLPLTVVSWRCFDYGPIDVCRVGRAVDFVCLEFTSSRFVCRIGDKCNEMVDVIV